MREEDKKVFVRETHIFAWTCKVCGDDVELRTRTLKTVLSCPNCGVTITRPEVISETWRIKTAKDREQRELAIVGIAR